MKAMEVSNDRLSTPHALPALALLAALGTSPAEADEVAKWNETADRATFNSGVAGNRFFQSRS
jgi:hypothetical protein